ncbi:trypsin-like peptidase domain-containing protein [Patescibacteria group bacterium]|nr:trypsin-like peptidase domain-containing protein [Patescibacteria group bacterium]
MEEKKTINSILKRHPRKFLFIFGTILGILLVSTIFTFVVILNVDQIRGWLGISEVTTGTGTTAITVTQEESNTINIVKDSASGVVSIAISKVSLSQNQGVVSTDSNIGTGFIVDANGWIVTNQHVVSDTTATYKVVTSDGKSYDVTEIVRDDADDIAILRIEATDLTVLPFGDSDNLVAGQEVIAIGTPLGQYSGSVTKGIVSGLDRTVTASSSWFGATEKTYEGVIQTDAAVNPGNSGGPLLDSQGKVVGVNFATTSGAESISFALPINIVKDKIDEYRTYGKFIKAYLGVSYEMISEYVAMYYNSANVVPGALVQSVEATGPAYQAGIRKGDIITELGGEAVSSSLSTYIQKHKVGDKVEVKVLRAGVVKTFEVTLTESD